MQRNESIPQWQYQNLLDVAMFAVSIPSDVTSIDTASIASRLRTDVLRRHVLKMNESGPLADKMGSSLCAKVPRRVSVVGL